ncbi:hypothetical protein SAY87_022061 [Trapa incisa]|uniref:Myb-like domain-containing protein n=1 Tax=Trapa incisa TaxID=236973 RepID=A0AAN7JY00_9MYRT|nr:hypothetical protein SAY87_022061 [Trapa incisa]
MGRTPSSKQTGDENAKAVKKGVWSAEEDRKLMDYIRRYGIWNWTHMPTAADPASMAPWVFSFFIFLDKTSANTTPISSNIHGHPSILESSSHPSISRASESEETSKNKVGDSDDVSSGVFPEAVEVDQLWEKIILSDPLQDAFMEDEFETMFMASSCWFDLPASMNYSPVESSYDGYDLEYDNLWEN